MKSKAICILGMHRSGTSTITRAVNLLGAYLGEEKDLLSPAADNPEGFWERYDIVNLNDEILGRFNMSWDTALPLPEGWHLSADMKHCRESLAGLVKKNFSNQRLWAWKDPRTTLLLDIWKETLAEQGVGICALFAVRNPMDVARSLEKRNGFPRDKSFGIWVNYNIAALKAVSGMPRVFVSYDSFLNDWETEMRRCALALGIEWPEDDATLKKTMNEFIRPNLRHSVSASDDLKRAGAPRPVLELYELLERAMGGQESQGASFESRVKELSGEFNSYARFFQHDVKLSWEMFRRLTGEESRTGELSSNNGSFSEIEIRIKRLLGRHLLWRFKKQ